MHALRYGVPTVHSEYPAINILNFSQFPTKCISDSLHHCCHTNQYITFAKWCQCAVVHPHLICGSLKPCKSVLQMLSQSAEAFLYGSQLTNIQTDHTMLSVQHATLMVDLFMQCGLKKTDMKK